LTDHICKSSTVDVGLDTPVGLWC